MGKNKIFSFSVGVFILTILFTSVSNVSSIDHTQNNNDIKTDFVNPYDSPFNGIEADIYENDDDFSSAKNISINTLQERSISTVDDVDYVLFTLDSFYSIEIETTGYTGDTRLWVFDYNHNQIGFDDDSGSEQFSVLSYGVFKPGYYFIKVDEFGNDDTIDNYNLTLSATLLEDPYEDDNTAANALQIVLNYDYQRSLYPVGDLEIFFFTILVSYNITLEITGTNGDTEMRLCTDPDNDIATEIAYDDDSGINGFSKIVQSNLAAMTYYIKIWEFGNNNTIMNYTLHTTGTTDFGEDLEGPVITVYDPFPSTSSSSEIILTADVTDVSGIDSVQLHYKLNDNPWETKDMINDMVFTFGVSV
ncbi:MAG: hypothetical protein ACTSQC_08690 [Candidatus Heimdallarchaeaceae archaeon]